MKTVRYTLLLFCLLLTALLLGCKGPQPLSACEQFLAYIQTGEYEQAYALLHSGVRYEEDQRLRDEENEREQSASRISKEQFVTRYESIFAELEISDLAYALTSSVEGDVICVYDYTLTYTSPLIGEQEYAFRMTVLKEDQRWTVEWSPSLIFPEMTWGDTVRVGTLTATRGEILANGVVYAETVNAVSILAVSEKVPAEGVEREQFLRQSALALNMTMDAVEKKLNPEQDFVILKQYYPDQYTAAMETELLLIPGISVDKRNFGTMRNYPQSSALAHIIGYVGPASLEDLERLTGSKEGNDIYNTDSRVGKSGLERQYEAQLRGENGYYIFISNASGENKKTLYRKEVQPGQDVQLTIDPELQNTVDMMLKYSLYGEDTAGAVVVMDPTTGAIQAASSYPAYDLNSFARGISQSDYQTLVNKKNTPLFNRLTQGRYPPGSIFKPFTAAAALESGAMTTETAFPENKGETIEDDLRWRPSDDGEFGPWRYAYITRVSLNHRHKPLNMHNGMIDSDNIYFAYAALRTGVEAFTSYMDNCGFNEAPPFDVPILASQMALEDTEWTDMLLAESAFGQGEILITPVQAAAMFSAFANGGSMMQPYLIEGLYTTDGTAYTASYRHEPAIWKRNVVAASSVSTILPMLKDVIDTGTGHSLRLDNIAGKTGTAQIGSDRTREIFWFAGFRLEGEPRLVIVMLELPANSATFSSVRFNIARELLRQ
ncbi:hypothetical protein LJC07_01060 [Christensenellaceae bacterium OttesenSCG-928-L17]|nr:hypothetical protein [Christensenellaceae bacterium OttesenSCG-928-L17]